MWSVLLILSLLCSQDVVLHAHDYSHEAGDHGYLSKIHSADLSHHEHHDLILYEVETNSDGTLKNVSNTLLALTIFILSFRLIQACFLRQVTYHHRQGKPILYEHYLLSPPLRAPPLR